jgi:hypothetical protein
MPRDPVEHRATVRALALTAQRVLAARQDAKQCGGAELRQLVMVMAPALLGQPGIGPTTAAQLLIGWSHHGRFRSEALRQVHHGPTRASTSRRMAQGKSRREVRRCLRADRCPPAVSTPGAHRQ